MKHFFRPLVFSLLFLLCSVWVSAQTGGTALRLFSGTETQRTATTCRSGDVFWVTNTGHFWIGNGAPCSWVDFGSGSGVAGANTALSNLASVSINTSLLAQTGVDAGSTTKPFRYFYLFGDGTFATTYIKLTGTPTGTRTWTIPDATDTFVGLAATQTLTNKTLGAATLSGTLSGGGNQINNVIIGTTTPLAGLFTTLSGSTSVTSPIVTNAGSLAVTTTASNGNITITPNGTGVVSTGKAFVNPTNSLTDNGSTIATDASLGNNFRVTALTASVTLSNPTNPTDAQTITWDIIQNASAAKTLAFDTAFKFGAEITACTISATLSSHNFITAAYNGTTSKWYVRGCITGY